MSQAKTPAPSVGEIYRRGYEHFNRGALELALADFEVCSSN